MEDEESMDHLLLHCARMRILWEFFSFYMAPRGCMILADKCYLCMEDEESMDHLLLHCARMRILWKFFSFYMAPRG